MYIDLYRESRGVLLLQTTVNQTICLSSGNKTIPWFWKERYYTTQMIPILETTLWTQQLDKQQRADQSLKHKFSWKNFQTESMKHITNTEQILSQNWMCGTRYQHWTIPVFTKPDALNVEFTLINSFPTKKEIINLHLLRVWFFFYKKILPPTPQKY